MSEGKRPRRGVSGAEQLFPTNGLTYPNAPSRSCLKVTNASDEEVVILGVSLTTRRHTGEGRLEKEDGAELAVASGESFEPVWKLGEKKFDVWDDVGPNLTWVWRVRIG